MPCILYNRSMMNIYGMSKDMIHMFDLSFSNSYYRISTSQKQDQLYD